jgi:hypothetical protein
MATRNCECAIIAPDIVFLYLFSPGSRIQSLPYSALWLICGLGFRIIRKKNRGEPRKLFETPKALEKSKLKGWCAVKPPWWNVRCYCTYYDTVLFIMYTRLFPLAPASCCCCIVLWWSQRSRTLGQRSPLTRGVSMSCSLWCLSQKSWCQYPVVHWFHAFWWQFGCK